MKTDIKVKLTLEDGTVYYGKSFGAPVTAVGEVVFSTIMTGYPESLTDPSYRGQILCLTYPLVGNYGVPASETEKEVMNFYESPSIQVSGLIVSDYSFEYSHWNASDSLDNWLKRNNIPGIYGIDTRSLTQKIRENGSMLGKFEPEGLETSFFNIDEVNRVAEVSIKEKRIYGTGQYKILLVDCGVKNSILKSLLKRNTTVIRVPWNYNYDNEDFDGIFISNGPGDPKMCDATVERIGKAFESDTPIFGVGLGNQLMALASGADTYKLKHGHRGSNQPVIQAGTDRAFITSQNHGFAVDNKTLDSHWSPLFININDQTNEGMIHHTKPFFSVQFNPEASGNETDTAFLFDRFIDSVRNFKNNR